MPMIQHIMIMLFYNLTYILERNHISFEVCGETYPKKTTFENTCDSTSDHVIEHTYWRETI